MTNPFCIHSPTMTDQSEIWNAHWGKRVQERMEGHPHMVGASDFSRELIERGLIRQSDHILSLGTGTGEDEISFARNGRFVVGMDHSKIALTDLAEREPNLISTRRLMPKLQDLTQPFDVKPATFDVVYAHQSLLYFNLRQMIDILGQSARALRPGGRIFVSVRSVEDWKFKLQKREEGNAATDEHGIKRYFFDEPTLRQLFENFFGDIEIRPAEMTRYVDEPISSILNVYAVKKPHDIWEIQ